jgi:hypothetical protein
VKEEIQFKQNQEFDGNGEKLEDERFENEQGCTQEDSGFLLVIRRENQTSFSSEAMEVHL